MSDHYFTESPESAHHLQTFTVAILGQSLTFETDAGTFSKGELDEGTRVLLNALPPLHGAILDMGCGWGAIGVAIGRAYPDCVVSMCDINQRALGLAARNAERNGVRNATLFPSDGFSAVTGTFDAIVTNPPIRAGKAVIYGMFSEAKAHLAPGGRLYIVIRKQQGAESAQRYLKGIYGQVSRIARDKGYWILQASDEAL